MFIDEDVKICKWIDFFVLTVDYKPFKIDAKNAAIHLGNAHRLSYYI